MFDLRPLPVPGSRQPVASPQIRLSALPEGTILHVLAGPKSPDKTGDLLQLAKKFGLSLRSLPPAQWFLVGDEAMPDRERRALLAALEPVLSGVDQSHGRVRIGLQGPMACAVLSKGTAVDLDIAAFPPGRSAATLIGHVSVHLHRIGEDDFEILVLRSFAEALWDDLALMCAEFV